MKRSWLARHPVGFMALYSIFYLSVFHYLESNVPLRSILVHCRLDDLIPFCKYAVIPYFAWFVWIPFTLFYLLWKAPREDFWRLCLPLFSGMTIALACYAVLPTALDLRPYWVPGSDIFARVVRFLYRTDTATNVCPSIHVFNSVTLLLAADGRRLSKRDGDQSLENLRAKYTAPEIIGKLAYAYGLQPEPAPRTPESLVPDFAWTKVPKQDICLPEGLF